MNRLVRRITLIAMFALFQILSADGAANAAGREADPDLLRALAAENAEVESSYRTPLYFRLAAETTGPMGAMNADPVLDGGM